MFRIPYAFKEGSVRDCYQVTRSPTCWVAGGSDLMEKVYDRLKEKEVATQFRTASSIGDLLMSSDGKAFGGLTYEHWPFYNLANRVIPRFGRTLFDLSHKGVTTIGLSTILNAALVVLSRDEFPLRMVVNNVEGTIQGVMDKTAKPKSVLGALTSQKQLLKSKGLTLSKVTVYGPVAIIDLVFSGSKRCQGFRRGAVIAVDPTLDYCVNFASFCLFRRDGARLLLPSDRSAAGRKPRLRTLTELYKSGLDEDLVFGSSEEILNDAETRFLGKPERIGARLSRGLDSLTVRKHIPIVLVNFLKSNVKSIANDGDAANMSSISAHATFLDLLNGWLDVATNQPEHVRFNMEGLMWSLLPTLIYDEE
jgi:hypothetical protein